MSSEIRIIYESDLVDGTSAAEIRDIARTCHEDNARHDISGFMLLHDGHFVQILEGPREETLSAFERIRRDPRNRDVNVISVESIFLRRYSDWTMNWIETRDGRRTREVL